MPPKTRSTKCRASDAMRLVIFDVDGTLVDSQGAILAAMGAAFDGAGLPVPERAAVLGIVGLSLEQAIWQLVPDLGPDLRAALVQGYRDAYHAQRQAEGAAPGSPLYPGARAALEALAAAPDVVLGVATGKSRRGLTALLAAHDLADFFVTTQVADDHPSKPHPAMIRAALAETGCAAGRAVMIGDTTFDMEMAAAAGVAGLGVGWGYHPAAALRPAALEVLSDFGALAPALARIWEGQA